MKDFKEVMMTETAITVVMTTSKGEITLRLFDKEAPLTVSNFINLIKRGYYDGLTFHRVIEEFMVQGGCPQGAGTGGPGYQFDDECTDERRHDKPGVLSMANAGPGTNGSQFFITHVATPWLDGKHTVFGEVVSASDQEVVNAIAQGDIIESIRYEGDTASLDEAHGAAVAAWNDILTEEIADLKPVG